MAPTCIEQFFKKEYNILVKRIRARGMQGADAEDVVQEAFYRALKYRDTYNPKHQPIGAWFNTIMNNAFKDYRHANFTGEYSFREEDEDISVMSEDGVFSKRMMGEVEGDIASKPEEERNILKTVLILGYSYKACCQVFDVRFARVQFVLQEFRKEMRSKYNG